MGREWYVTGFFGDGVIALENCILRVLPPQPTHASSDPEQWHLQLVEPKNELATEANPSPVERTFFERGAKSEQLSQNQGKSFLTMQDIMDDSDDQEGHILYNSKMTNVTNCSF
ncbi:hypothetical protein NPIL_407481 [Nephila pilipes]|uniref:Uncharacterized protein n=1 Tax=Nephila pilipes TaxID=299642 RepID=A0A8X6PBN4_NEPPI|nr:hypothetical protein NPIL_407481 [Nephila pilipes]